jgi:hypothetical protein
MFNTKLSITNITNKTPFDFSTKWEIKNNIYMFHGKKFNQNEWVIGFDKNSDETYQKLDSDKYVGDIFTGVIESLKMLLQENKVEIITFNTENTNSWLVKLYNGKHFQRYMERQFNLILDKTRESKGLVSWRYINKG